ncbi:glycosyltransferase family 2 protein [Paraglaciecola chathamensis]|uniref:Glycosyltransferase family 2 protein n=1 Tax=Paraglaciecola chathamensis TaxID=368405 RepID=A0ABS0W8I4_9ALTE|nr:glycosyltransferase family 2 protein [Paraglaciecola chathamensis]MBJ2135077.1 glycosyltransferase family 2 protein [Paraglaciecola chathamensis]
MKEEPLVSIILPVYNVELYLAECLDSVLRQTYCNFELIAINDGSTDSSLEILKSYIGKFSGRLLVVNQENKGLSAARNAGLDKLTGELVYFLDSDDWILDNTLEKCVKTLMENDSDLVIFNAKAFCDGMPSEILRSFDYNRKLPRDIYEDGGELLADSMASGFYIVQSCCYIYKFSSNPGLKFIDGILHEDNYFTTMLFLNSSRVSVLQDRFFQRRIRKNSITTSSLTMKHAIGYYKSAEQLSKELSISKVYSNEICKYYNYLVISGFNVENEISNGSVKFTRKLAVIYEFRKIINFKVLFKVLFPELYKALFKLVK